MAQREGDATMVVPGLWKWLWEKTIHDFEYNPRLSVRSMTNATEKELEVARQRWPPQSANHGASADQVSAGHVDVDCPISHRRDDVLAGTGCAGVCA